MNERNNDREPAEGVRIIGAEEAQAALDAGVATGRRSEDELRFGDVPPAPSGPRPVHRFPLPDSVDPAEAVPRSPIAKNRSRRGRRAAREEAAAKEEAARQEEAAAKEAAARQEEAAAREEAEAATRAEAEMPAAEAVEVAEAPPAPAIEVPEAAPAVASAEDRQTAVDREVPGRQPASTTVGVPAAPPETDDELVPTELYQAIPDDADPPDPAAGPGGSPLPLPGDDATRPSPLPSQPPAEWRSAEEPVTPMPEERPSPPSRPSPAPESPGAAEPAGYEPSPSFGRGRLGLFDDAPPPDLSLPRLDLPGPDFAGAESAAAVDGEDAAHPGEEPTQMADVVPDDDAELPYEPEPPERITLGGGGLEMPHWTDPPTGEVPRIRISDTPIEDDELGAWQALGTRGTRWRDEAGDWDDVDDMDDLVSDEAPVGALDTTRAEHSDIFSFDKDFERLEEERSGSHPVVSVAPPEEEPMFESPPPPPGPGDTAPPRRPPPSGPSRRPPRPPTPSSGGSRDVGTAVAVGAGMIVVLLIAYFLGSAVLTVVAAAVVGAAAAEGYGMLQRAGFRPATLLGLVASVGLVFAAYWKGPGALPLVIAVTFAATMAWYLWGIVDARPLANVAVTVMIFVWVGVLGSFAALMLQVHDGRGLFLGAVVTTVACDIAAYFAGSQVGSRPMAPNVSPGKTWEGSIAGLVAALVIGAVVGKTVDPWGGIKHGLLLGLVVGIIAPLGDLAESMVKRDLGIKDSGGVLPGHGGLLDRFDSVLLVLPAAYYLAFRLDILR